MTHPAENGRPLGRESGGDPGFWDRLDYDEGGLPVHLPMGVNEHGQGPTEPDPAHHYVCWCGDVECPLTLVLGHAWAAGRRVTPPVVCACGHPAGDHDAGACMHLCDCAWPREAP